MLPLIAMLIDMTRTVMDNYPTFFVLALVHCVVFSMLSHTYTGMDLLEKLHQRCNNTQQIDINKNKPAKIA